MDHGTLRQRVEAATEEVVRVGGVPLTAAVNNLVDAKVALSLSSLGGHLLATYGNTHDPSGEALAMLGGWLLGHDPADNPPTE